MSLKLSDKTVVYFDLNALFSDDYDENNENYEPYVPAAHGEDDEGEEQLWKGSSSKDIKPDLNKFNFKVPSSSTSSTSGKVKRKRGRPKKEPASTTERSKRAKKPPRKSRSNAKKQREEEDLEQDFIDDSEDLLDENWEGGEDDDGVTNIKTEDGQVIKVPKKRKRPETGK